MADELKVDEIKSFDQVPASIVQMVEESLASNMGWIPESQYSGPKEGFVSARDFIKNTTAINESLRKGTISLEKKIDGLDRRLVQQEAKHQQDIRNAIAQTKADIKKQMGEAAAAGDAEKHTELMAQLDEVDKQERELPVEENPVVAENKALWGEWLDRHPLYNTDRVFKEKIDEYARSFSSDLPYARRLEYADVYAESLGNNGNKGKADNHNGDKREENRNQRQDADMIDGGVGRSGNFGGQQGGFTLEQIKSNPEMNTVMQSTLRLSKGMTEADYVKSVNEMHTRRV